MRDELMRLAVDVRRSARDVFAHRGVRAADEGASNSGSMWRATRSRRYPYAIKRDHSTIQALIDSSSDPATAEAVLVAIERSVPVSVSIARETAEAGDLDEMTLAARALMLHLITLGVDRNEAAERVAQTEPFDQIAGLALRLAAEE
jgi:hypothetical protein